MKNLVNKIETLEEEVQKNEKDFAKKFFINEMKKIGIERLPYSYSSLKRFIDPETMDVHYNKHYKGYVDKLNKAIKNRIITRIFLLHKKHQLNFIQPIKPPYHTIKNYL